MAFLRTCTLISVISTVVVQSKPKPAIPAVCLNTAGFTRGCPRACARTVVCKYGVCQNCNLENIGQTVAEEEELNELISKSEMELPVQDPCNLICPKTEEALSEELVKFTSAFRHNGICTCASTNMAIVPVVG